MTNRGNGLRTFAAMSILLVLALLATACQAQTTVQYSERQVGEAGTGVDGDDTEIGSGDGSSGDGSAVAFASAADVYESIVDSIVFVETPQGTGTGIVIEDGWILTNAHVVERYPEVRIGRSDGIDLGEYPVFSVDWVFDLALVGPVDDAELIPFDRSSSSDLSIGDPVMLIGFPDETNMDPTPTLTSGIVSRRRSPAVGDFPFVQVDATIAPGQSGGALVDMNGDLMGISGLEFGEGEFGLAFEADAMWPRIDDLKLAPSDLVPASEPVFEIVADVGPRSTAGFIVEVDAVGRAQILAIGDDDLYMDLRTLGGTTASAFDEAVDPFVVPLEADGRNWFIDELLEGGEELDGEIEPGVYQVIIGTFGTTSKPVTVTSANPMRVFADLEEGAELPVGLIVEGEFDWSGDSDLWELPLEAGDSVTITSDGIADTLLSVRLDGLPVAGSDDELLGLFGVGARVEFVAPSTGVYEVEVGTFDDDRWGYLIEVAVE
jgi:hypothetical protein